MVGDTVGRGRHSRRIWNTGDRAQRLGRLKISQGVTSRDVDTGRSRVFAFTDLKRFVLGVVRGIVRTTKAIIDVLAKLALVMAIRITYLHTEGVATHEADLGQYTIILTIKKRNPHRPVANLLVAIVIAIITGESVRVHERANRVTTLNDA